MNEHLYPRPDPDLLTDLAQAVETMAFQGAAQDQIEAVVRLQFVSRFITEHCRKVMQTGVGQWEETAELMETAVTLCRNHGRVQAERQILAARRRLSA